MHLLLLLFSLQTSCRPHRLPATEQPPRVLVHGRLRAAELPRVTDRVRQHVRAADNERPVPGQHAGGRATHALPRARAAQSPGGLRTEVRQADGLFGISDIFIFRKRNDSNGIYPF